MCGIVGYVGHRPAASLLVEGLRRLEYRGYDSAGLGTILDGRLVTARTVGRVRSLEAELDGFPVDQTVGIAHTRWATHGGPLLKNAHPHTDAAGKITLVHNGIVENHAALRAFLTQQGVEFHSDTDTESLVQLIGFFYQQTGDFVQSVRNALREVHGTFGIAVLCADVPQTVVAARRGSPLIVGLGDNEYIVSSDAGAIVAHTSQVTYLDDNEVVCLGPHGLKATNLDDRPVEKSISQLEWELERIELSGYEHHMLKEIDEQPESLRNTMRGRIKSGSHELVLGGLQKLERELSQSQRILQFGCGTAWHAALIGQYLFEELARIPTRTEYSSELRYRNPIIEPGTLAIAVSQSGETADTLAALREVRTRGALALGVVNAVGSSIARETDAGVYLHAGPEIGVASTKAFTAQVLTLLMLAIYFGRRRHLSQPQTEEIIAELARIPDKVEQVLQLRDSIAKLADRLAECHNCLYLGRGVNYPVALEGALKLKEISYIHAEGLPAAEMKHGPIAMIDEGMYVIVLAPYDHTYAKVIANIEEVRSRGGRVIAIANHDDAELDRLCEQIIHVPPTLSLLTPLLNVIPLQLLAYYTAVARGFDVDKPRNLAKSVTVE